jgi:hypothetical protein
VNRGSDAGRTALPRKLLSLSTGLFFCWRAERPSEMCIGSPCWVSNSQEKSPGGIEAKVVFRYAGSCLTPRPLVRQPVVPPRGKVPLGVGPHPRHGTAGRNNGLPGGFLLQLVSPSRGDRPPGGSANPEELEPRKGLTSRNAVSHSCLTQLSDAVVATGWRREGRKRLHADAQSRPVNDRTPRTVQPAI